MTALAVNGQTFNYHSKRSCMLLKYKTSHNLSLQKNKNNYKNKKNGFNYTKKKNNL